MNDQTTKVSEINRILNSNASSLLGISANQSIDASGVITYSVFFNTESFFSNNFLQNQLEVIQNILKPFDEVFGLLTTEIPLISDFQPVVDFVNRDSNPQSISLLDIIGFAADIQNQPFNIQALEELLSLNNFIEDIPSQGERISLGEFTVDLNGEINNSTINSSISPINIDLPSGFKVPLLDDPKNTVFKFLQGENTKIFEYILPDIEVGISGFSASTPGPGFTLGGDFDANVQLGFGFDTFGLQSGREFDEGFYLIDFPESEISISPKIRFGPSLSVTAASLDVTLGVGPQIEINLADPSPGDGVVRLNEVSGIENLFDFSQQSINLDLRPDIEIFGKSVKELSLLEETYPLDNFPPGEIQARIDEILGYIEQISGFSPRIVEDAGKRLIEVVNDAGKVTREAIDRLGNFIQEEYENGVKTLERVWGSTGDFLKNEFDEAGNLTKSLVQSGGQLVETVFDGISEISKTTWDGVNVLFEQGEEKIEWVDEKLKSIISEGKTTLFNSVGDIVDGTGKILRSATKFIADPVGILESVRETSLGSTIENVISNPFTFGLTGDEDDRDITTSPPMPETASRPTSSDLINRSDGSIFVQTGSSDDFLEGTGKNDEIRAAGGNDFISGKLGNDFLFGDSGNDYLDGGDGEDILFGGTDSDSLFGGTGGDEIFGQDGNDLLDAGDEEVPIELFFPFNKADTTNKLDGGAGSDTLVGGNAPDLLEGGAGNDLLTGNGGSDYLDGGAGIDTVSYETSSGIAISLDQSSNTAGNFDGIDSLDILVNIEHVIGSPQRDRISGNNNGNNIFGEDGNDTIEGLGGVDFLTGDNGDDSLEGGSGNDIIAGGNGDDTLIGGIGDDLLIPGLGVDSLDGGLDIDTANFSTSTESITIDLVQGTGSGGSASGDSFQSIENVISSPFDDTLSGDLQANKLEGRKGDDLLTGNAGNDTLDGGEGNDTVSYKTSTEIGIQGSLNNGFSDGLGGFDQLLSIENIIGSNLNDAINGNSIDNNIRGEDGGDIINGEGGDDRINGGLGNDSLTGGTGNDRILGEEGDDVIAGLDGADRIDGGLGNDLLDGGDGDDRINGGLGNDSLTGGAGNDRILGEEGDDVIAGLDGADRIDGGLGNDLLNGGDGDDALGNVFIPQSGNDTLIGGAGDDLLYPGQGPDSFKGGIGIDTVDYNTATESVAIDLLSGIGSAGSATGDTFETVENVTGSFFSDTLTGDNQANFIDGLDGDDLLVGNGGIDFFDGGNGIDTVSYESSTSGIRISLTGDAIPRLGSQAGVSITVVDSGFDGISGFDRFVRVENVIGSSQNDRIIGSNIDNDIRGEDGNDTINGEGGNDRINGGLGNDFLVGGTGNDRILGEEGDDVIEGLDGADRIDGGLGNDLLDGGDGNDALGNVFIPQSGNDTLIGGAGDDLLYPGQGPDSFKGGIGIDTVDYNTATESVAIDLLSGIGSAGSATGDTFETVENVTGSFFSDTLTGDNQANFIDGLDGDDLLVGNGGDDFFDGGNGIDTVSYESSTSGIRISLTGDVIPRLDSQTGVGVSVVDFGSDGINGLGGRLVLTGVDRFVRVENVIGSSQNDRIIGNNIDNDIRGEDGNDTIEGLDGNDILTGSNGDDQLLGNEGNDVLRGGRDADQLVGGLGDDTLLGGNGADSLNGENGNDILVGSQGVDILEGGIGNDELIGGGGVDTYRFADDLLDGIADTDMIQTFESQDILDFSAYVEAGGSIGATRLTSESLRLDLSGEDTVDIFGSASALDAAESQI